MIEKNMEEVDYMFKKLSRKIKFWLKRRQVKYTEAVMVKKLNALMENDYRTFIKALIEIERPGEYTNEEKDYFFERYMKCDYTLIDFVDVINGEF